jgi:hypothetical protein
MGVKTVGFFCHREGLFGVRVEAGGKCRIKLEYCIAEGVARRIYTGRIGRGELLLR